MACEGGFGSVKFRAESAMKGNLARFGLTTLVVRAGTVNRTCGLRLDNMTFLQANNKKECIVNEKGTGSSKNDTQGYCSAT